MCFFKILSNIVLSVKKLDLVPAIKNLSREATADFRYKSVILYFLSSIPSNSVRVTIGWKRKQNIEYLNTVDNHLAQMYIYCGTWIWTLLCYFSMSYTTIPGNSCLVHMKVVEDGLQTI